MSGDRERRRAGIEGDALAVRDHRRRRGADLVLGLAIEPFADPERALRAVRSREIAPPCARTSRPSASSASRSFRIVTVETREHRGEVADPGAAVLLDESGDPEAALAGEDVGGDHGGTAPFVGVRRVVSTHANRTETKVSTTNLKSIETHVRLDSAVARRRGVGTREPPFSIGCVHASERPAGPSPPVRPDVPDRPLDDTRPPGRRQ